MPTPVDAGACNTLLDYVPTATTAPSFATDVYPLLMDTSGTGPSCSYPGICHGSPAITLNSSGAPVTMVFLDQPANVLAALLQNSVNAPSMKRVVPGNVADSFLAYKIAGNLTGSATNGTLLACASSMCASGASVGVSKPCGDPMPTVGMLTSPQVTLILDWIAKGAMN